MSGPQIILARTGQRDALVIAAIPPGGQEQRAPSAQTLRGETLVVGCAYRFSKDGEVPEDWRAYLWPVAGGNMHVTQSCEAVGAPALGQLRDKLQKRGPWWDGEGS